LQLELWNTYGRTRTPLLPIENNTVRLYACGPTVYNYAHIGNLRTYIFVDVLRRTIEFFGFGVKHVMNVTDVGHLSDDADDGEDKVVLESKRSGKSVWEIAEFYTDAFMKDIKLLNIKTPSEVCKATSHIDDMIALIKRIEDAGFTYSSGGNLYFDIGKFPEYGKIALLSLEDLQAGARIDVDEHKHNPHDFVLWFTNSKFERQAMIWDSPWGRGYPGWHIECSAMAMKYLGEEFDIHCGGIDHIPVHHTNEIAQSQAATGIQPARIWMHAEFLLLEQERMSKSSGKFLTLAVLMEKGYSPLDYRYFCLQAHYRIQLKFSFDALDAAKAGRRNLVQRIADIRDLCKDKPARKLGMKAAMYEADFRKHCADDLNMPRALALLWDMVKDADFGGNGETAAGDTIASEKLALVIMMDSVLGLSLSESVREDVDVDAGIQELVDERQAARKNRDFKRADEIRALLDARGIVLEDTPQGVRYRKK